MLSLPANYDKEAQQAGLAMPHATYSETAEERTLASVSDTVQAPTKGSSDYDEEKQEQRRHEEVGELARQLTRQSTVSNYDVSPFNAPKDSALDPHSANFNARAWAKALLNFSAKDNNGSLSRTSGIAFRNLSVHGFGSDTDYQKTVGNLSSTVYGIVKQILGFGQRKIQILNKFDGLLNPGDMLVVLGPPGSGCSTFLKTLAGETHGIFVDPDSYINYKGISAKQMHADFRGEAIYTAEVDVHFPNLSVGDTLEFAARARAPRNPPGGIHPHEFAQHYRDVIMAMFGISHTINTRVGNDFVRGVSGGERKRVSIAEAALSRAPFQCWDNSTRGLDSANAIEFCKTLRTSSELGGTVSAVAIYQAPQSAYDIFNKVTVLYEGRQIYFGPANEAKQFFTNMGYHCPDRQTTADFLTSLTSPAERIVRSGYEGVVPQTPDEFATAWKASEDYARLVRDIDQYEKDYPIGGEHMQQFLQSRRAQQARFTRPSSPYTLSY